MRKILLVIALMLISFGVGGIVTLDVVQNDLILADAVRDVHKHDIDPAWKYCNALWIADRDMYFEIEGDCAPYGLG